MRMRVSPTSAALLALLSLPAWALDSTGVTVVPTYEAAGVYWSNPGGSSGCGVQFRKVGDTDWRDGLGLVFDAVAGECRGSLVNLAPGTSYELQLSLPGQAAAKGATFATWPNQAPVAKTIALAAGSGTVNITEGGTATGYVVYDGGGAVLDAGNAAQFNVTINASYVIVRNLVLKGAQQDAIRVSPNVTDVVIEDNDISGWGRTRDGTWGTDMDSGIRAVCTAQTLQRVTIQRNRIHDPRYSANSWSDGHPAGPQGITFSYCGGNHVIRWNEIYSSANHFNDGMGGEDNFSTSGFPNADSDIYGNRISYAWDDGIESEGGNRNVRIWGNYLDNTATGVATTLTSVGPVYIFRNVFNRNRFYEKVACDADERQPFFKSGSSSSFGNGRRYLFHNTMLQAAATGCAYGLGGGAGVGGTGDTQLVHNTISMNNIYHLWKPNSAVYQVGSDNTFQNDMFNGGSFGAAVVSGINATPQYAAGNGWQSEAAGAYQLAAGTPGFDQGVRIANFNDDFLGLAPDVGAAEGGAPAMVFGVAASTYTPADTPVTPPPPPPPPPAPTPTPAIGTAPVSPSMDSSSYTIAAGASVTFTAVVKGGGAAPTGTVSFADNGTPIASCQGVVLINATALCTTSALTAGTHKITGNYSGDATYGPGVAGPITETVTAPIVLPASFGMDSSSYTIHKGDSVTFTAYIPGTGGTVNFTDNAVSIAGCGAVTVPANGIATCSTKKVNAIGQHAIRGLYSGTPAYAAGVAGPITVTVTR